METREKARGQTESYSRDDQGTEHEHLSKLEGWLDANDSFFETIDKILKERTDHIPRKSETNQ
jgi:hypothetical protein